jgi:GxxExxY protein
MSTEEQIIYLKDEVYRIAGCAMDILNKIGHGFPEKIYESALAVAFDETGIPYRQQPRFEVKYKDKKVGEFIPDLIAYNQIIIETKTIECISHHEKGQVINYLKVTGLKVGIILNFKYSKLEWERVVL